MTSPPSCSVVVPVHGRPGVTARCLDAVLATVGPEVEIVAVDDASPGEVGAALAAYEGRVRVLTHDVAAGFARSCNDGAAAALAPRIVFLNSDTLPQPGWLDALRAELEAHPNAAVAGSRLLYPDGTVQHAGVVICQDRVPRHVYRGFPGDHPAVARSRRFPIVTGACALFRRDAFERAGGFDAAFRNGYEDVDLCLRLGELGYEVRYCAESVLVHLESVSLAVLPGPERAEEIAHNARLYRERWEASVEPDDLRYYLEDGLVELGYPASYPLRLRMSPLLGVLEGPGHRGDLEGALAFRERQAADLLGDLVDLTVALAETAPPPPLTGVVEAVEGAGRAPLESDLAARVQELQQAIAARRPGVASTLPTRRLAYAATRRRLRAVVARAIPSGATVLVATRGDEELLDLDGVRALHFPQADGGIYAGAHPATSADAIRELEALRRAGAGFLLLPDPMRWWLDHYDGLARHLRRRHREVVADEACVVYALEGP